jgi:hypothetical protein
MRKNQAGRNKAQTTPTRKSENNLRGAKLVPVDATIPMTIMVPQHQAKFIRELGKLMPAAWAVPALSLVRSVLDHHDLGFNKLAIMAAAYAETVFPSAEEGNRVLAEVEKACLRLRRAEAKL